MWRATNFTKNRRKNNRLTDNKLWNNANFRTGREDLYTFVRKYLNTKLYIKNISRLIRKCYKIYVTARVLFGHERRRVGRSKKKRNGRGSVGVEEQLRCITRAPAARTLRCALYFVGVIFTMRRVSSIISRSGKRSDSGYVSTTMCRRMDERLISRSRYWLWYSATFSNHYIYFFFCKRSIFLLIKILHEFYYTWRSNISRDQFSINHTSRPKFDNDKTFVKKRFEKKTRLSSLLKCILSHQSQSRLWKWCGRYCLRLLVGSRRKKNGKSNFSAGATCWVERWTTCAATCKETQGGRSTTSLRSRASTRTRSLSPL